MAAWARISGARGYARGELDGVAAERRDPAPRVHDHRQPPVVRERHDLAELGVGEPEPLGARMQLDSRGAEPDGALGLPQRAVVRIDAAERHEPAVRQLGGGEHPVVGGPVGARLREREDDGARIHDAERRAQLGGTEAGAVRIRAADVRMRVEQPDARQARPQRGEPRLEQRVRGQRPAGPAAHRRVRCSAVDRRGHG